MMEGSRKFGGEGGGEASDTLFLKPNCQGCNEKKKKFSGLVRDSNPGPLAPKARIMPLDQQATLPTSISQHTNVSTTTIATQS